jgi:hypothetical protein
MLWPGDFHDCESIHTQHTESICSARLCMPIRPSAAALYVTSVYRAASLQTSDALGRQGINRVFVRSTLSAGTITLTASRAGLKPAQVKQVSKPVQLNDGVADYLPQHLARPADK